jgi:fucose 4-O-acetylase-like acetyltransferase
LIRFIILSISSLFIFSFCLITPNAKIPAITYLGQNTVTVYLFHGFAIRLVFEFCKHIMVLSPFLFSVLLTTII